MRYGDLQLYFLVMILDDIQLPLAEGRMRSVEESLQCDGIVIQPEKLVKDS